MAGNHVSPSRARRCVVRFRTRAPAFLIAACVLVPVPATAQSAKAALDSLLAVPVHAAARYAQSTSDAAAAVTVITADEIAAFGYRTLDQVLARAAGFYTSDDRNYTYVGVRGFSRPTDYNNRVLLLLNGQPVNEHTYGSAPMGDDLGIDLAALERVEIVRGPVSALYGTSAMLAVVNLVTIDPPVSGVTVSTEAGSAGRVGATARAYFADAADRSLLLSVQWNREDGEDLFYPEFASNTQDGVARELDWTRQASALLAGRTGDLRMHARIAGREKGIPTASWDMLFGDRSARTIDRYAQLATSYQRALRPNLELAINAAFDWYQYRGWYPGEGYMFRDATDGRRFGADARTVWDISARQRLVGGIALTTSPRGDYRTWTDEEQTENSNRSFSSAGVYLQNELFLNAWASLVVGGRVDAESDSRTRVTPRASLLLHPFAETTLKLLYGEAFRSPNLYERSFNAHVRTTSIEAERIRTSEMVAEHRLTSSAALRISLFNDEISRLIDPYVDPVSGEYTLANAGTARTRGVEGEITVGVGSWLLNGSGSVLNAVDRASGERLTNAPRRVFRFGANGPVLPGLTLATQVRAESGRLTTRGQETSAFSLLDVALTYRLGSHLRAALNVNNALNESYAYPGGLEHAQDQLAQDGRRLHLRLEINR